MEGYLRLFPLNLVAFPGEELNLHIFEDRYKQLIEECLAQQISFGIPSYVHATLEFGSEVKINQLVRKYEDGRMDISTEATRVFKVISFENPVKGKLYAGGEVEFQDNIYDIDIARQLKMIELLKEFYVALHLDDEIHVADDVMSFHIAHKVGLSLEEEYELLKLPLESERQDFVIRHLKKAIPLLREIERTKQLIKMNGHFKHFDKLDY